MPYTQHLLNNVSSHFHSAPYPNFLDYYHSGSVRLDCIDAQEEAARMLQTASYPTRYHTTRLNPLRQELRTLVMQILLFAHQGETFSNLMHAEHRNEDLARRYYVLMETSMDVLAYHILARAGHLEMFIFYHGYDGWGRREEESDEEVRVRIEELREMERMREEDDVLDDDEV